LKHLVIGTVLILIGLSLFSPIEEIFIVGPLSLIFGLWIIPAWTGIAILSLGIGIFLVGKSKYIPNPIAKHIWAFITIGLTVCAYLVWSMI